jgi:hypothetical protein
MLGTGPNSLDAVCQAHARQDALRMSLPQESESSLSDADQRPREVLGILK